MIILFLISIFFLFPGLSVIIKNVLSDIYFWQIKEYRWDRVISSMMYKESQEGRHIIFSVLKFLVLACLIIYYIYPTFNLFIFACLVLYFIYIKEADDIIKYALRKRILRPKLRSPRNLIMIALSVITVSIPFLLFFYNLYQLPINNNLNITSAEYNQMVKDTSFVDILPKTENELVVIPIATYVLIILSILLIIVDFGSSFVVIIWALLTSPLAYYKRNQLINKAKLKLNSLAKLKIVAITGSYGKTTTKELLHQVLSSFYKTVKTPENKNTDVGIAQTILHDLKDDTEIFIAEMGAYKKGEIKKSTQLAPPDISLVTAVEHQHLTLFGNMESLFQAKYEIVEGAKDSATIVLNADNEWCMKMAEKTSKNKSLYFVKQNDTSRKTKDITHEYVYGENINIKDGGLNFDLNFKGKIYKLSTNIPGRHNVSNLLAVIVIATSLGVDIKELVKVINNHKFIVPYLNTLEGLNGISIIDDGYNISESSFLSGLRFLRDKRTKGRKWVVTQGIIELGKLKDQSYKKISKEIMLSADGIITTDELLGLYCKDNNDFAVHVIKSPFDFLDSYKTLLQEGDMVLIEGSMPMDFINTVLKR
jgi:UDP-N-acetylmuramoyl-tripeptide--D-alanyl-D-alanine ligase